MSGSYDAGLRAAADASLRAAAKDAPEGGAPTQRTYSIATVRLATAVAAIQPVQLDQFYETLRGAVYGKLSRVSPVELLHCLAELLYRKDPSE